MKISIERSTNNIQNASQLNPRKVFGVFEGTWLQQSKIAGVPFFIEAQPTDICNFSCHYCSYAFRRKSSNYASWDLSTAMQFAEFIREEPVRVLCLSGGGEPLTWQFMPEFLEKLIGISHVKKMLITNGSLIGKRVSPELLQDFSCIIISIASTDEEICRKTMRGAALFQDTFNHVLNLVSLFGKPRPDLNACVIVSRTNDWCLDRVASDLIERGFDLGAALLIRLIRQPFYMRFVHRRGSS